MKAEIPRDELHELWREAQRRLRLVDTEPPVSAKRIERFLAKLPKRRPGEHLRNWLARSRPIEFLRWAADTDDGDTPLPDPDSSLESEDGRFRLNLSSAGDRIHIALTALGFAADEFAHKRMSISTAGRVTPLAVIALDEDGNGSASVEDTKAAREVLLKPEIRVLE
ncbi:MAG: hypothetical protein ACR2RB_05955 [Gammaproteobacteria bacterium]